MLTRLPVRGDKIVDDNGGVVMTVDHVRDKICYECEDERKSIKCFIAQFRNGEYNNQVSISEE